MHLPEAEMVDEWMLSYCFVGDEAFPLKQWMLRPDPGRGLQSFSRKVYNYRLSRARRTIENAFGKHDLASGNSCS